MATSDSTQSRLTKNIVRARVTIRGTRPLVQHEFGPDAIPLEKGEKTGVAGNDPLEWKRSCMVTENRQLFLKPTNIFGCIRDAAKHTKKGKGSIQPLVAATLQIEDSIVCLDRSLPEGEPPLKRVHDDKVPVYVYVCGVRNPSTKARNVRYRLAAAPGWQCTFTIRFDKTVVPRELMRAVLNDAGVLVGIADGRSVGEGRFEVLAYEELTDAEEAPADGSVETPAADRLEKRRKKVQPVQDAAGANGSAR